MLHNTYIRTRNVTLTNRGKLESGKQDIESLNIAELGVRELKWTRMGHFQLGKYKVFYSGNDKPKGDEVSLMLRQDVAQAVRD